MFMFCCLVVCAMFYKKGDISSENRRNNQVGSKLFFCHLSRFHPHVVDSLGIKVLSRLKLYICHVSHVKCDFRLYERVHRLSALEVYVMPWCPFPLASHNYTFLGLVNNSTKLIYKIFPQKTPCSVFVFLKGTLWCT